MRRRFLAGETRPKEFEPWRDTAIAIRGPAVADIEAAFADSWMSEGPPIPRLEMTRVGAHEQVGNLKAWVIAGRPDEMSLYRLEQLVAEIAEHSLWLTDAYFVGTTGYVHALCGAAKAGVDVRLLVPGSSNWPIVGAVSRAGYRSLLEAGVRVFEWNGTMLHAKTAVADGCWSRVGSSNSNLASWTSNRELDVTIQDADFAAAMAAMYERDLENATEIVLDAGRMRAAKNVPPAREHPVSETLCGQKQTDCGHSRAGQHSWRSLDQAPTPWGRRIRRSLHWRYCRNPHQPRRAADPASAGLSFGHNRNMDRRISAGPRLAHAAVAPGRERRQTVKRCQV